MLSPTKRPLDLDRPVRGPLRGWFLGLALALAAAAGPGAVGAVGGSAGSAADEDGQAPDAGPVTGRVDDGRTARLADASASACVRCHEPVLEEWRVSAHALAWVDERYQKALSKVRRPESCTGCHIPEPLAALADGARPRARAAAHDLGVDCATCHLAEDGETVLGPLGLETEAHATRREARFEVEHASATCLPCHATTIGPVVGVGKDFVASGQAELGQSCTGCHMPVVRRPFANHPDGEEGEPYPERRGRSHVILGPRDPAFLRRAFALEAEAAPDKKSATLVVANRAGHRVPGMKERRFVFRVRLFDADGDELDEGELVLDTRAFLPVDGERRLTLSGRGAARLEVEAVHDAPGLGRGHVFLERGFELDE